MKFLFECWKKLKYFSTHFTLIVFWCERHDLLCSHSKDDIFTCEDKNMSFSHVKISSFRAKAHLVLHWCLYNKNLVVMQINWVWSKNTLFCFQKPLSDSSVKDLQTSNKESVRRSVDTCLHCNVTKLSKQDVWLTIQNPNNAPDSETIAGVFSKDNINSTQHKGFRELCGQRQCFTSFVSYLTK